MICPANVKRSTMAAHRRGSVNVFVHDENGSLEAIAMDERSSRSVNLEQQLRAAPIQLQVPQFVDQDEVDAAVAVDQLGCAMSAERSPM